jgi:hypothetical protein
VATLNMQPGEMDTLNVFGLVAPNPGAIVGTPTWSSSNIAVAQVGPARDGRTCQVIARGAGTATITVNAQGATALSGSVTVVVAAQALATSLGIGAGGAPTTYPGEQP